MDESLEEGASEKDRAMTDLSRKCELETACLTWTVHEHVSVRVVQHLFCGEP